MQKQSSYSLEKAEPVIDKMKKVYYVQSSEVASLSGLNQYNPVEQAMLRFMKRVNYKHFKDIVKIINVNEVVLVTDALLKKNKIVRTLFYGAINAKDNDILQNYFEEIYDAIEETTYYKTMKECIQKEVKSRINKKRGNKYEHKGINQYEKKTKHVVTDRNSEMFEKIVKREEDYTIVLRAKIDGIDRDNNCLIEHKNRVNELFEKIPSYEKVQLEIYMHITKLGSCKLVQTHFEDTSELPFESSVKRWKKIKFALIKCIRKIHEIMEEPEKMKRFMSKYRKYL
jgi:hypothetical protein